MVVLTCAIGAREETQPRSFEPGPDSAEFFRGALLVLDGELELVGARTWADRGEKAKAALAFGRAAQTFAHDGRRDQAILAYGRAIILWRELGERAREAGDLNRRGLHFKANWAFDLASADFDRAAELGLRSGDLLAQASAISNLAGIRQAEGQLGEAKRGYETALELLDTTSVFQTNKVNLLRYLAQLELIQGDTREAEALYERARSLQHTIGFPSLALTLDIAWLRILQQRSDMALAMLDRALADRSSLSWTEEILLLNRRGIALLNLQEFLASRLDLRAALARARDHEWKGAEAGILASLCELSVQSPQPIEDVEAYCDEAASLVGDPNLKASVFHWSAESLHSRGLLAEALEDGASAVDLLDSLRLRIEDRKGRARFLEDRADIFRKQVALEMEAHAASPTAGHDVNALAISERLRARSLLELWAEGGVDFLQSLDAPLQRLLAAKLTRLKDLDNIRFQVGGEAKIEAANRELDRLSEDLRRKSADYRKLTSTPQLDLAELQGSLDEETALIEILLGEPESFMWIVERGRLQAYSLPPRGTLESAATTYLEVLKSPSASADLSHLWQQGSRLASLLWGSDEERLKGLPKRLVFVGDGTLQQYPFSALPRLGSTPAEPRYLLDDHELVALPALSFLGSHSAAQAAKSSSPSRLAMLLVDPLYRLDDVPENDLEALTEAEIRELFPGRQPDFSVGRLPSGKAQADQLVARFANLPIMVSRGSQASKVQLQRPEIADFAIIHMTSHGWLDPKHLELSAMMLSEVDAAGNSVDGKLRLQDLYWIRLDAELVVASACQTGVGTESSLEGATGLAQGFFHAGARRAMVSQWPVESEATARLMDHFYRHLLAGEPPAGALRAASLDLRKDAEVERRPWSAPYYWAPFVLIGDWRPFELPGVVLGTEHS